MAFAVIGLGEQKKETSALNVVVVTENSITCGDSPYSGSCNASLFGNRILIKVKPCPEGKFLLIETANDGVKTTCTYPEIAVKKESH